MSHGNKKLYAHMGIKASKKEVKAVLVLVVTRTPTVKSTGKSMTKYGHGSVKMSSQKFGKVQSDSILFLLYANDAW